MQNFGLITPVLTMLPRSHAQWERTAGIEEVRQIAALADSLGVHHITCSEHVAIPDHIAAIRGTRYWDPLATFGYLAAHTTTLQFATHVLVLGYHHPLEIAKRYGTLDQVSGGRVILGVGVGSLREEFQLLNANFTDRGALADDALKALRAALGVAVPQYKGSHYAFNDMVIDPVAARRDLPIWIGGRTARSLRRASELGDGWAPFGLTTEAVAAMLTRTQHSDTGQQRSAPLEVWLQPEVPVDPLGAPEACATTLRQLFSAGATGVNLRFVHHSLAHYLEQLEALAQFSPQLASLD